MTPDAKKYTFTSLQQAANNPTERRFRIPQDATIRDPFLGFFENHRGFIALAVNFAALVTVAAGAYYALTNTAHAQNNNEQCQWGPQGDSQLAFMEGPQNSLFPVLVKGRTPKEILIYKSFGEGLSAVDSGTPLLKPENVLTLPNHAPTTGTFEMEMTLPDGRPGGHIEATVVSKTNNGGLVVGFAGPEPTKENPIVKSEHNLFVSGGELHVPACAVGGQ